MASVPTLHRLRKATPRATGPVSPKVWKEAAPSQWQVLHIYDEADQH
jgi:hypothetical protein